MLLAQERVPIDTWRDPLDQGALVTRLADALHGEPDRGYTVRHAFARPDGSTCTVDDHDVNHAIVTVTTWKD